MATRIGTSNNNIIRGTSDSDVLIGRGGDDILYGRSDGAFCAAMTAMTRCPARAETTS